MQDVAHEAVQSLLLLRGVHHYMHISPLSCLPISKTVHALTAYPYEHLSYAQDEYVHCAGKRRYTG